MDKIVTDVKLVIADLSKFYGAMRHFLSGGSYESRELDYLSLRTRVHLYGWALTFHLWDRPHYRCDTFSDDLKKNLRNVALPATGIPLSLPLMCGKFICMLLFLILYPLVCVVAAVVAIRKQGMGLASLAPTFGSYLLCPEDWFSLWQLNCRLASYHALKSGKAEGYKMEDKQDFIDKAESVGIPVTPCLTIPGSVSRIVMKDRNEEGGMGMRFFHLAQGGGPWMMQKVLTNSDFIKTLVPPNAPLSTFRVITMAPLNTSDAPREKDIVALSCVFRAGRAGAETDHRCIMFDIKSEGLVFAGGTTNAHWYCIGFKKTRYSPTWFSTGQEYDTHPDMPETMFRGKAFDGERYKQICDLCTRAHNELLPDVPLAGWDVAFTNDLDPKGEEQAILLEVNLSCNFFRGSFDVDKYFECVNEYFVYLDGLK